MSQDLALWVASIASMLGLLGGIMRWVVAQLRDVRKEAAEEHAALRAELGKLDERDRAGNESLRQALIEGSDRREQRLRDEIDRAVARVGAERTRGEDLLRDEMRRGSLPR